MSTPSPDQPIAVDDRVVLGLATIARTGTVIALTSDGTRAGIEWDDGAAYFHDVRFLKRVGGMIRVQVAAVHALCDRCEVSFGLPPHLEGHPWFCPYGHRNEPAAETATAGDPR